MVWGDRLLSYLLVINRDNDYLARSYFTLSEWQINGPRLCKERYRSLLKLGTTKRTLSFDTGLGADLVLQTVLCP
jgi:hypothetical protein